MANIYVNPSTGNDTTGNGSSGNPYKTINKAHTVASNNDTILLRSGTYHERIKITKTGITLKNDTGHTPILDGNYHDGLFTPGSGYQTWMGKKLPKWDGPGFLPGQGESTAMVEPAADNVTVQGLTIRNIAGEGISTGTGDGIRILDNTLDFIYGAGIGINGGGQFMEDLEISGNTLTRCSVKIYCPDRVQGGGQRVAGTVKFGKCKNAWVHHNTLAYGYGEGMDPGKYNEISLVEYNVIHTMAHACMNCNRSDGTIVRFNLLYHCGGAQFLGDGDFPAGITWGDEEAGGSTVASAGGAIYGNIIVGLRAGIKYAGGGQYGLQLNGHYCGFNTVICPAWAYTTAGGARPLHGIQIIENKSGHPHKNSIFENNLVLVQTGVPGEVCNSSGALSGITCRNNNWSATPPSNVSSPTDQIGSPNLLNPFVKLTGPESDDPLATSLAANGYENLKNYKLTNQSNLPINHASSGSTVNGLTPPRRTHSLRIILARRGRLGQHATSALMSSGRR